jgi:hypothetical protein
MKFSIAIAASLFALAACQPATTPTPEAAPPAGGAASGTPAPEQQATADNCALTVERAWGPIGPSDHPSYRVKVWTTGSVCESSVVTLAIFARDGFPIYTWAGATQYLFALRDAKTPAEMATAMEEWIGPDNQPPELTRHAAAVGGNRRPAEGGRIPLHAQHGKGAVRRPAQGEPAYAVFSPGHRKLALPDPLAGRGTARRR